MLFSDLETLIKNVLKDLEKHQVNVENLSSTELDEIADTIATAIQSVDIQEETEKSAGKTKEDKTEAQMKKGDSQGRGELQTGLMENSVNIPGIYLKVQQKTATLIFLYCFTLVLDF